LFRLLLLADNYESAHSFSDFANWLVPGTLLVGRYPYVEPSRCKTYQQGEQKLDQILKAGVTTFVSLQVRKFYLLYLLYLLACAFQYRYCRH
jgi:alanine transaminase